MSKNDRAWSFVILWKYWSLTEVSKFYKNDNLCQIFPNGVMEYFVNFQNILENDKSGRYLESIFVGAVFHSA